MGLSSSGTAAFTMAWFHPELYHRVLAYSPTMVNQQWPWNPSLRGGAWEYHSAWTGPAGPNLTVKAGVLTPSEAPGTPLIPNAPTKPIRYWFEIGDQDLFYPNPTIPDGMHDWTLSAGLMAKVLAAKGYHYQFLFVRNAKHVDRPTVAQTMPAALEGMTRYLADGPTESGSPSITIPAGTVHVPQKDDGVTAVPKTSGVCTTHRHEVDALAAPLVLPMAAKVVVVAVPRLSA
jgi:hypothetical protein